LSLSSGSWGISEHTKGEALAKPIVALKFNWYSSIVKHHSAFEDPEAFDTDIDSLGEDV
jgi:hypothetical protein